MTITVHEWGADQACKRCCIPKNLAHKPQLCPGKPPSARQAARMRWPLGGADAQALEGALTLTEKERDALQAKLDAELPAAWRENLASLNECLDQVGRERDGLREEVARLNTLLLSVTGENQKRAEREARALEDWRELRAENDRLKASHFPDVEYARLDTMWQQLVRERDEALHEDDVERLRAELVQVAAVAVRWVGAIDARGEDDGA